MELTAEQLAELINQININKDNITPITADDVLAVASQLAGGNTKEAAEIPTTPTTTPMTPPTTPPSETEEKLMDGNVLSQLTPYSIGELMAALSLFNQSAPVPTVESVTTAEDTEKACGNTEKEGKRDNARKYANIFVPTSATRQGTDFKSRISNMNQRDKNKVVYGSFGRAVKCIHASKGDIEKAAYTAEKTYRDSEMAREFKALGVTSPVDGGYLVPETYANEIIELLYPSTVINALGARRLSMQAGNLNIPKIKTGARAMFTGENRPIPKSKPTFGNLKLSAKKLTALIPMSNDLLRSTSFDNDVIVGQDITKQMALGVDYGALLGTGGQFEPLGILNNNKVTNIDVTKLDASYASSAGLITASFPNYLVAQVLKNNVYADGLGFVFNTTVEQYFKSIRDEVGGFIFADEMNNNGTLVGYQYKTTNLIETASGKTSIIFGNWNDLIIGEQGALEIVTSVEGSWTDDSGRLVSAFENDQTLIRAINNIDTGLRHDESFVVATKVAVPM